MGKYQKNIEAARRISVMQYYLPFVLLLYTSSEGSAIMIRTVAMLSRRRRYCQQCGTGSGSCFQQPGRWFALVCPGSSVE